jgi:cellulose biosynthesis protein BcsQ
LQIAFWSNYHQTGTTLSTVAMATMTILEYRLKALLTHNHFEKSSLEKSFLDREYLKSEQDDISTSGIDALSRFLKFSRIDKENVTNYTTTLIKDRLEMLIGTSSTNKELYNKDLNEVIETILLAVKDCYDMVFVDVASGMNELTQKIFNKSDLIVANLSQNYDVVEDFISNHSDIMDKSIILLGRYDQRSRFNVKALQRKFKIKGSIAVIPYNIEFADSCCEGKAIDFLLRNIKADKDDGNYYFIQEVKNAVELMFKKLKLPVSTKKLGD